MNNYTVNMIAWKILQCDNRQQRPQLVQHGDYWVYRNYVMAAPVPCFAWPTLVMQGTYEDIYKLPSLFKGESSDMMVSFAIYVPDQLQYHETIKAIAYVRKCTPPASDGLRTLRLLTSYHLYFHQGYVSWSFNQYPDKLAIDCGNARDESAEGGETNKRSAEKLKQSQEDTNDEQSAEQLKASPTVEIPKQQQQFMPSMQTDARIIGYNIAQLAAPTKFIFNANVNTYPTMNFIETWVLQILACGGPTAGGTMKTVLRVPAFVVHNFDRNDYKARLDKDELERLVARKAVRVPGAGDECYPMPCEVWMYASNNKNSCSNRYRLRKDYEHLLNQHLHFFGDGAQVPLLPEHKGLSLVESENLRLYNMALQNFDFFVPFQLYVLVNATAEDSLPRNRLPHIDVKIRKQHEILFNSSIKHTTNENIKKLF